MNAKEGVLGAGFLAMLAIPGVGWAILGLIIFLVLIMLGVGISIYFTLQSLGLVTAIVLAACAAGLLAILVRISPGFTDKYPLSWLVIPGAFGAGYLIDRAQYIRLSVAPYALTAAEQTFTGIALVTLAFCGVTLAWSLLSKPKPKHRKRKR